MSIGEPLPSPEEQRDIAAEIQSEAPVTYDELQAMTGFENGKLQALIRNMKDSGWLTTRTDETGQRLFEVPESADLE